MAKNLAKTGKQAGSAPESNGAPAQLPPSATGKTARRFTTRPVTSKAVYPARLERIRQLLAADVTDQTMIGKMLRAEGLLHSGLSAGAVRVAVCRAVAAARHANPELVTTFQNVEAARYELIETMDQVKALALNDPKSPDLAAIIASAKTKARVLGVDTERPIVIEETRSRSVDWKQLAARFSTTEEAIQEAFLAAYQDTDSEPAEASH